MIPIMDSPPPVRFWRIDRGFGPDSGIRIAGERDEVGQLGSWRVGYLGIWVVEELKSRGVGRVKCQRVREGGVHNGIAPVLYNTEIKKRISSNLFSALEYCRDGQ